MESQEFEEYLDAMALSFLKQQAQLRASLSREVDERLQQAANEAFNAILNLVTRYEEGANIELNEEERAAVAFIAYDMAVTFIAAVVSLVSNGLPAAPATAETILNLLQPSFASAVLIHMRAFEIKKGQDGEEWKNK